MSSPSSPSAQAAMESNGTPGKPALYHHHEYNMHIRHNYVHTQQSTTATMVKGLSSSITRVGGEYTLIQLLRKD